jgi:hypothetical protein
VASKSCLQRVIADHSLGELGERVRELIGVLHFGARVGEDDRSLWGIAIDSPRLSATAAAESEKGRAGFRFHVDSSIGIPCRARPRDESSGSGNIVRGEN